MSWFGGGSKKETSEKGFVTDDTHHFESVGGGGGSSSSSLSDFQQFSVAIQQQMAVQQAISDLSEKAFAKCVSSYKDSQLSGREVACIHAVTNKWIDANQYMVGRLEKKQQQQQQLGGGGGGY